MDVWFEKCGALNSRNFRDAISDIIDESRTFPTPGEVKKQAAFCKEKSPAPEDKKVPCGECRGSGAISASKVVDDREMHYAFRCGCLNGEKFVRYHKWEQACTKDGFKRLRY